MNKEKFYKNILPYIIIGVVFLVASMIYFVPALEGKIIFASDNINGLAGVQEAVQFHEQTGERTWWCGSLFSGMPNYQIGGGQYLLDKIMQPLRRFFSWGNRNALFIMLFYLVVFFCLLRSFKMNNWLAMAGAFAMALSSYFFIIIAASHHGKCYSITWMILVVVGFILTYRKQYGWGAVITMFFTYIGFFLHPQMSYYICMMIGVFWFAELAIAIRHKEWKHFGLATLIWFACFGIGMGMGAANVFANQEYAEQTMRGGHSDLAKETDNTNKTKGLDLDYATAWSYGINETMTLLVPNYMGGSSGYNVGEDSHLYKDLVGAGVPRQQAKQFCQGAPTYWGEKAFTSGAVYVGAIVCFLFVLGLILVDGPYKWALLAATLFSILLAWGHNFMPMTEFFFKYFPMYNKFRAVESILIVAEIAMPLLGMLALKELSQSDKDEKMKKRQKLAIYISAGITGGVCLIIALFGGVFTDFTSSYDAQWKNNVDNEIYQMILDQREAMMKADAWRSLLFIALSTALTLWYVTSEKLEQTKKTAIFGIVLALLIVADMWPVDKRFCNDANFVSRKRLDQQFTMLPYEHELLENDTTYYRVLNLATNTFNDARTSYYLKSIGGYSAAKLRRYQDLIDEHIAPEMGPLMRTIQETAGFMQPCEGDKLFPVLNMLNMKYAIVPLQNGEQIPLRNPYAMGNAWLVDSVQWVGNANAESDALKQYNLHHVAIADSTYAPNAHLGQLPEANVLMAFDTNEIVCTKYEPNRLEYHAQSEHSCVAVFSEIYYPYGWHVTIDGAKTELFRVNYMLRAINLPAGDHQIVMIFDPDSVHKGNKIAMTCFMVFLLTLLATIGWNIFKKKKGGVTNK